MTYVPIPYPRYRHHPERKSVLVQNPDDEQALTPDAEGWRNDRDFVSVAPPAEVHPTIEAYVAAGYLPEHYPPIGHPAVPSPGLSLFEAGVAYGRQGLPKAIEEAPTPPPPVKEEPPAAVETASEPTSKPTPEPVPVAASPRRWKRNAS